MIGGAGIATSLLASLDSPNRRLVLSWHFALFRGFHGQVFKAERSDANLRHKPKHHLPLHGKWHVSKKR